MITSFEILGRVGGFGATHCTHDVGADLATEDGVLSDHLD